jgi:hypothetical protein
LCVYRWVYSPALPQNDTAGHNLYNPAKSPTAKNITGAEFDVYYVGEFGASGYGVYDHLTVGGITLTNQTIDVATALVRPDLQVGYDGILGLGLLGSSS